MNILITTSRAWEIALGVVSPGFSTILSGIANSVKLINLSSDISRSTAAIPLNVPLSTIPAGSSTNSNPPAGTRG